MPESGEQKRAPRQVYPDDMRRMLVKVAAKVKDYRQYNFGRDHNDLLKAFFDLVQEYDSLPNFYRICVAVPLEFLGVDCALYLMDEANEQLELVCSSAAGTTVGWQSVPPEWIQPSPEGYATAVSYVLPVFGKVPRSGRQDSGAANGDLLGMFEVGPLSRLTETDIFFFEKYANRIGYSLYNRLINRQNISHLKFINNLVLDIEHNVIIPNMYFKYLFRQLKKKIEEMGELETAMQAVQEKNCGEDEICRKVADHIHQLRDDLFSYNTQLQKHHDNITLFLESLFRREHFERGHLVLHTRLCRVEKEIIKPQLEQYMKRLEQNHIGIDYPGDMEKAELPLLVDKGLLSQVYANLFSNAVKYTGEITDHLDRRRKAISYGWEKVDDPYNPGFSGVKFNVFSTGPHLHVANATEVYTEGYRGENSSSQPGTGHGLAFVKLVVELHGGHVGYEATPQGNNFFFILPLPARPKRN